MSKLIIPIIEGINNERLYEWIDAGYLTNFKRIYNQGSIKDLKCTDIPYEPAGLVSAFSGEKESEHGIMAYFKVHNKMYTPELWHSDDIKHKMFWNTDAFKDHKIGVVNVFGTDPVYEVNGCLLSYAMKKSLHYCYPEDLIYTLSEKGIFCIQDTAMIYHPSIPMKVFYRDVKRIEQLRHKTMQELLKTDLDIIIVNYTLIERVSHFCTSELYNDDIPLDNKIVFQAYKECDKLLGDVVDYVEETNSNMLFFSEVGFGPLKSFVSVNKYLAEKDLLKYDDSKKGPIWNKTVAFESVQGSNGININRKSIYNEGIVEDSEYESILNDVISVVKSMENPYTHEPMFSEVIPGREIYKGSQIPDIILKPFDWHYLFYGDDFWGDFISRNCQTGWHRSTSVWGGIGPDISNNVREGSYSLIDILPSVYRLMKKEIPGNLSGKSFLD